MNKYRNVPKTLDGHRFPSHREARRYQELKLLEKAGVITHLSLQPRFPLCVNGERICTYVADFRYREGGLDVVEDCKGVRTAVYRIKKKLLWAIRRIEIRET